jgi:hypothetical protein
MWFSFDFYRSQFFIAWCYARLMLIMKFGTLYKKVPKRHEYIGQSVENSKSYWNQGEWCDLSPLSVDWKQIRVLRLASHFWRRSVIRLHRSAPPPLDWFALALSLVLITRAHIITNVHGGENKLGMSTASERLHVSANKDAAIKFCHANLSVCRQRWMERDCGNVMKPARNNVVQLRRHPAATRRPKWMRQTPQRGAQRPPTDTARRAAHMFPATFAEIQQFPFAAELSSSPKHLMLYFFCLLSEWK